MRFPLTLAAAIFSTLLTACGGGGSTSAPAPTVTKPVVVAPAPFSFAPAALNATYVAGYPAVVNLVATPTVTFVGIAYIKVEAPGAPINPLIVTTPKQDGTFDVRVTTSATATVGEYAGDITVSVCADPGCASHLAGSPFKVPYKIEVVSPEGSFKGYNLSPLTPLAGAPDWGTFQGNASHTGHVPVTLDSTRFNLRWKFVMPAEAGQLLRPSMITTGQDKLYVSTGPYWGGQMKYDLYAFNENDAGKAWSQSFGHLYYANTNPPSYSNGTVYMVAGSQESTAMYGFDAATGTQVFKSPMRSQWEHYLAPTVLNGTVYTNGGGYGGMYAFDAASGTQTFFADLMQVDGWTPAVDSQYAYAYMGQTLYLVDAHTGVRSATITVPGSQWGGYGAYGAPVIGAAGSVFVANYANTDGALINVDVPGRAVRWTVPGSLSGNPAYANATVFAANNKTFKLEARKEADGQLLWSWALPLTTGERFVSDVVATDNLVFVSTNMKTYAIDRSTQQAVWSHPAPGHLSISSNGILYIRGETSIIAVNLR